jgi:hypothetical protein
MRPLRPALALVLLLSRPALAAAAPEPAAAPPSPPCSAPEYRRLDFWVGDWDAYEVTGKDVAAKPMARCRVDAILGGCVLRETYEQNDGLVGQSFTIYDAGRKVWHQSWVTNKGRLLTIEGTFSGDALTLSGILRSPEEGGGGPETTIRGIWKRQADGVRETAETSTDGATWKPLFDILFRAHGKPLPQAAH